MNASDNGAVLSTESSHGYMYVPDQDSLLKQPKAYQTDPDDLLFLFLLGGGAGRRRLWRMYVFLIQLLALCQYIGTVLWAPHEGYI